MPTLGVRPFWDVVAAFAPCGGRVPVVVALDGVCMGSLADGSSLKRKLPFPDCHLRP